MAIVKISYPTTPTPASGDWAKLIRIMTKAFLNLNMPKRYDDGDITEGALFSIQGVLYFCDEDTAISGDEEDYVYISPDTDDSTATAYYTSDISDVSWNSEYGGYYDSDGNYYIIDEAQALLAGDLSTYQTWLGELYSNMLGQDLRPAASPSFDTLTISGDATLEGDYTATGRPLSIGGEWLPVVYEDSSITLGTETTELLDAGMYTIYGYTSDQSLTITMQNDDGDWETIATTSLGFLISDGTNIKITNPGSDLEMTVYYRKY